MLSVLLAAGLAVAPAAGFDGAKLEWRGQQAHMTSAADGGYVLDGPFGTRRIPAAPLRSQTASPLVDGLFAMAQQELAEDSVDAIRDPAYDHGAPMPCRCYVTGVKWPYVWTRDVSYAIDLGLWRFDAQRARDSLRFKLSEARAGTPGLYVMQDTGSGGSWPISTDRVVWFLAARHLLDDPGFAADARRALRDTLAQERAYAYDAAFGLYRGETSFLDWREQTYPAWTQNDVAFIGQSFALSTNVLHYQALELAATQAQAHGDAQVATDYRAQADALKAAINRHFWREDRGLYMSYIGGDGTPYDTYDLLGTALAVSSGVATGERAREALAHYPTWPAGSPVIWPERRDQPVYHNRAIWPFVSAYALRAARATDDPARIAHELVSILRGAALAGSNMENYELQTQAVHVDEGTLSGPVVNSPRQLWSVAAALEAMLEGVFGLTGEDRIEPKLPAALVPALFGKGRAIALDLPDRRIVLQRPAAIDGNLLVTDRIDTQGRLVTVTLKAVHVRDTPLRLDAPLYAPEAPPAPAAEADGDGWRAPVEGGAALLYVNGRPHGRLDGQTSIAGQAGLLCLSATRVDANGIESLHSPDTCVGPITRLEGDPPRAWTAPTDGSFRVALDYTNPHGPINTGITAAVKMLVIACDGAASQRVPLVMPHSVGAQRSTFGTFTARAGAGCRFTLEDGFNMSYLARAVHYTAEAGGATGPLNEAQIHALVLAPLAKDTP